MGNEFNELNLFETDMVFNNFQSPIPAYSPDINIIEPVWNEMKKFVHKVPCNSIAALSIRIREFINNFNIERCQRYVNNFKTVLKEIIARDGAWTDMQINDDCNYLNNK